MNRRARQQARPWQSKPDQEPAMNRDVDCSHLFPLEGLMREFPRATTAALLVAFSSPGWVAGLRVVVMGVPA